jgi:hypothetical protein
MMSIAVCAKSPIFILISSIQNLSTKFSRISTKLSGSRPLLYWLKHRRRHYSCSGSSSYLEFPSSHCNGHLALYPRNYGLDRNGCAYIRWDISSRHSADDCAGHRCSHRSTTGSVPFQPRRRCLDYSWLGNSPGTCWDSNSNLSLYLRRMAASLQFRPFSLQSQSGDLFLQKGMLDDWS